MGISPDDDERKKDTLQDLVSRLKKTILAICITQSLNVCGTSMRLVQCAVVHGIQRCVQMVIT